jgi:hypothetical protein
VEHWECSMYRMWCDMCCDARKLHVLWESCNTVTCNGMMFCCVVAVDCCDNHSINALFSCKMLFVCVSKSNLGSKQVPDSKQVWNNLHKYLINFLCVLFANFELCKLETNTNWNCKQEGNANCLSSGKASLLYIQVTLNWMEGS